MLDVSCNRIKNSDTLEEALTPLTNIACLNFGNNQLTRIPKAVGGMKSMIWLNLFMNEIEEVDEEVLAELKQYFVPSENSKSIRLSCNRIKKFPIVFTEMVYLQELHLGGNSIPGLIFFLFFFSCPFLTPSPSSEIPDAIIEMQELIVINFANNACKLKLPPSISKLPRLRKLYLRGTELEAPPPSLFSMLSLVELDLSPNVVLGLSPNELGSCRLHIGVVCVLGGEGVVRFFF